MARRGEDGELNTLESARQYSDADPSVLSQADGEEAGGVYKEVLQRGPGSQT